MAKKLTSKKAKEILHDKSVHGKPLTDKQRRYFGWIAGGGEAQKGFAIPPPTTQDSLNLYNAQMTLNKFYENEEKAGRLQKNSTYPISSLEDMGFSKSLQNSNLDFYRGEIDFRNKLKGKGIFDDQYKNTFGLSSEQIKDIEYEGLKKTKSGNKYQQYYRDLVYPAQNLASPMAMVDYRIKPQRTLSYRNISPEYPGGEVQVFDYDPLAIKPVSMLTPQEKAERIKKYGKNANVGKQPPVKTQSKKVTENPFEKYGTTGQDLKAASSGKFYPTPNSDLGDGYYILDKGKDKFKYYIQSGGANWLEKIEQEKPKPKPLPPKKTNQPNTLFVDNPNDPRLKSYQDSLKLYNLTKDVENPKYYKEGHKPSWYAWNKTTPEAEDFGRKHNMNNLGESPSKFPGKIKPVGVGDWGEGIGYPIYKKPVQPVVYKKSEPTAAKEQVVPVAETQPVQTPPPPPMNYNQGTPVYAPTPYSSGAGAFVGFRNQQGDTVYVKPEDYERMGVPGYGKKFIESRKKEAGGSVYVGKSRIQGRGLFTEKPYRAGETIGKAHKNGQPTPTIGMFHNHSTSPSAHSVKQGKDRFLFATRDLAPGEEITTNYYMQPELEQPEDFQAKGGMGVIADNGKDIVMPQDGPVQRAESPNYQGLGYSNQGYNYNSAWGGRFQSGGSVSSADSVRHQANKILKYEQLKGGPGGSPLPNYSDPRYMDILMKGVYPEVKKIMPNASAMETGEAMDFIFNAGWDKNNNKITKDPRAYALQEYYKKYDPSKVDKEGKWPGRKNAPYSFDEEYANTIGNLPENERRVLMNKGRDWYYQNINNPSPGVPSSDYYDTWYGRIWNTNDYNEFNPNNPKLKHPSKKQAGGFIKLTPSAPDYYYGNEPKGLSDELRERVRRDMQQTMRPGKPVDIEERNRKNKQYAATYGMRYNDLTGGVEPLFSDNADRTLRRTYDNVVEPLMYADMAYGLGKAALAPTAKAAAEAATSASKYRPFSFTRPVNQETRNALLRTIVNENQATGEAAKNEIIRRANRWYGNTVPGQSNSTVYNNLDDLYKESQFRQDFPEMPALEDIPEDDPFRDIWETYYRTHGIQSEDLQKFLEGYNPNNPFANMSDKRVTDLHRLVRKDAEDYALLHNKNMWQGMKEEMPADLPSFRGGNFTLDRDAEAVADVNAFFDYPKDWKELAGTWGNIIKREGFDPTKQADVEAWKKMFGDKWKKTRMQSYMEDLRKPSSDLFKGISYQQAGGAIPGGNGMMYARTGQDWKPKMMSEGGSSIPSADANIVWHEVSDAGDYDTNGEWQVDWKQIAKEARQANAFNVKLPNGTKVSFDGDWNILNVAKQPKPLLDEDGREIEDEMPEQELMPEQEEMEYQSGGKVPLNPFIGGIDQTELPDYDDLVASQMKEMLNPQKTVAPQIIYVNNPVPVTAPVAAPATTPVQTEEVVEPGEPPVRTHAHNLPTTGNVYKGTGVRKNVQSVLDAKSQYDNETFRNIVHKVADEAGVDPRFLWSSSYVEGMNRAAAYPNETSIAYAEQANKHPELRNYKVDGFRFYGLDNFGSVFPELVKKGYLPKDFDFKAFDAINELNSPVKSAAFKTNEDAIRAKAAFLKHEGDRVKDYADKLGVDLQPNEFYFLTMAAYNGGQGAARNMLRQIKNEGISPFDYIQRGSNGQVYKNVIPRYKMMYEVMNEFESGGQVTSEQDMGQLEKLDQLINFTNYNPHG